MLVDLQLFGSSHKVGSTVKPQDLDRASNGKKRCRELIKHEALIDLITSRWIARVIIQVNMTAHLLASA